MPKSRGLLISFDGVDSSGKETQSKKLVERLRYQGHVVRQFTTPDYSTPSGQELKARLQNKIGDWSATPWEEKMRLFATNRLEHREEVIQALCDNEVVVYDRYVPSSLAFITVEALSPQKADAERDKIQQAVADYEYVTNNMPQEAASIFLDVPPLLSAQLLEKRKEKLRDADEYTDHLEVQQRLYNEYDVLCAKDPKRYIRIKCVSGDEMLAIESVAEIVWDALTIRFPILRNKSAG